MKVYQREKRFLGWSSSAWVKLGSNIRWFTMNLYFVVLHVGPLMVHPTKRPCVLIKFWPVLSPNRTTSKIAGEIVFFQIYPLVMTNIAIEHCHRNREFSHWNGGSFHSFLYVYQIQFSLSLNWDGKSTHLWWIPRTRTGCATVPPEPFARPCRCLGRIIPLER